MRRRPPPRTPGEEFPGATLLHGAWERWQAGDRSRRTIDDLVAALVRQRTEGRWRSLHWFYLRLTASSTPWAPDAPMAGEMVRLTEVDIAAAAAVVARVRAQMGADA